MLVVLPWWQEGEKEMYRAISILTAFFLVSTLSAAKTSLASEETSSVPTRTRISPSIETSQERNLLRQLAVALAAGSEALSGFCGSSIENEQGKDRFNPPIPGMDCSVDDFANYVSCYSSAIGSEEEADRRFIRLINELQAVLPSDRWRGGRGAAGAAGNRFDPRLHL
jgi:hypothetical protein